MSSRYEIFDRSKLRLLPIAQRISDIGLGDFAGLTAENAAAVKALVKTGDFKKLARAILAARKNRKSVILMMGAHVIRAGGSPYIIGLMEKGLLTGIALNGAGVIHDYEFARFGKTTENVAKYIKEGQFGLWKESGEINDIINDAFRKKLGLGEAVGRYIEKSGFPFKKHSLLAAGYRLGIPVTAHIGIGYDFIHQHPNADGAALGATSYRDFLIFTRGMENLEGGALLCMGSAIMGPEVYLKALSMVRNTARQEGRTIEKFTAAVFDVQKIRGNYRKEPSRSDPCYFFRPWKTLLARTTGGSYYFNALHQVSIPALHKILI